MRNGINPLIFLSLLVSLQTQVEAQPRYRAFIEQTLGGDCRSTGVAYVDVRSYTSGSSVNEFGVRVPCIWVDGSIEAISERPGEASAVCSAGYMAGYLLIDKASSNAFFWEDFNKPVELDAPIGVVNNGLAVNNNRSVVGFSGPIGGPFEAVYWPGAGSGFSLGLGSSIATGINDLEQIVGFDTASSNVRAFVYDQGNITYLENPLGDFHSFAYAVNSQGFAIGAATITGEVDSEGVLWDINGGTATLLGSSLGPITAKALNSNNQIVGFMGAPTALPEGAFLWENGKLYDLREITQLPARLSLTGAYGIDENGNIIARGMYLAQEVAVYLSRE